MTETEHWLQTTVRLPARLNAYLKQKATENRRSFNAEILVRLEESRRAEEEHAKHR